MSGFVGYNIFMVERVRHLREDTRAADWRFAHRNKNKGQGERYVPD